MGGNSKGTEIVAVTRWRFKLEALSYPTPDSQFPLYWTRANMKHHEIRLHIQLIYNYIQAEHPRMSIQQNLSTPWPYSTSRRGAEKLAQSYDVLLAYRGKVELVLRIVRLHQVVSDLMS